MSYIEEALQPVPPTRNIEWLSGYKVWWVGVLGRGLKGRAIAEPKDRSIESLTCQVEGCFKDDVGRARFEGTIDGTSSGVCAERGQTKESNWQKQVTLAPKINKKRAKTMPKS